MNASLMRAMGGGNHDSSLQPFSSRTFSTDPLLSMMPRPATESSGTAAESSNTPAASTSDIVAKAAATFKVDPSLVSAVIKAESGGNPRATSPAGAMGLMQLMPGTARELGVSNPYDPVQNVMGGTKYLKSLLNRYGGNRDLALAAYNWGPGNLEKSHRSMPRETVDYVARIKKYLGVQA